MSSIAGIATGNASFSILSAALAFVDARLPSSNLIATLSAKGANLTVFAPTDAAFGQLAADLGFVGNPANEGAVTAFLTSTLTPEIIRDVLLYHVSAGAQTLADIGAAGGVTTLNGTITANGATLIDAEPDLADPTIVQADIHASNGIIHVIDRVLLPIDIPGNTPLPTITGIVAASGSFDQNSSDFDLLLNAVTAAGLAGALDDPSANLTVFAPNDAAFLALASALGFKGSTEEAAFGYLVEALTLLSGGNDPIPLLTDILLYHVSQGTLDSTAVLGASQIATLLGTNLGVAGATLVDAEPDIADPNLIATDIHAANGIVHVLDGVLIPADLLQSDGSNDVDFIIAGDGANLISTGRDNDYVDANGGADFVVAGRGNDAVLGGNGRDILLGGSGNDLLKGDAGRDMLYGEGGSDTLNGGTGRDMLFGGAGADVFAFGPGSGHDVIAGFSQGDRIDLSGYGYTGFGQIQHLIADTGTATTILLSSHDSIRLRGVEPGELVAADFLFA